MDYLQLDTLDTDQNQARNEKSKLFVTSCKIGDKNYLLQQIEFMKDTIKFVCKLLAELGVGGLSPEAFRLAKSNDNNNELMPQVVCKHRISTTII